MFMLKKKLKGFTLVEIIVALAVFAVMSLIVVMILQMSSAIMKDSQYTTKKADTQSILAKSKVINPATDKIDTVETKIELNGVTLSGIKTVEIEGVSNIDSELNDNSSYNNAPNAKVFTSNGTVEY